MRTNKLIIAILSVTVLFSACKKKEGCTDPKAINYDADAKKDDGTCVYESTTTPDPHHTHLIINFNHSYDGFPVTSGVFGPIMFVNQTGSLHSIEKLQYLVSDFTLYKSNGDSVVINDYQLVDLSVDSTLTYVSPTHIEEGNYTGFSFKFGFDTNDNVDGAYTDLNAASWSWPMMLGGGYHFMKFEGRFIRTVGDTVGYQMHMGTAREITTNNDTIYHDNHFRVDLSNNSFNVEGNVFIEVDMNLAEWFKNPNAWDLNTYYSSLMPNYTAQVMMNQNGRDVFTVTKITP
ncbi:MAG: hypothetical protein Kow0079_00130 [Vicingaceae bacterium]